MKASVKKYLLIAIGLLLLALLSSLNRGKSGPCCPFSIKPVNNLDGMVNE
jgi:hypothetical protein